jgi:hypothetical protein
MQFTSNYTKLWYKAFAEYKKCILLIIKKIHEAIFDAQILTSGGTYWRTYVSCLYAGSFNNI